MAGNASYPAVVVEEKNHVFLSSAVFVAMVRSKSLSLTAGHWALPSCPMGRQDKREEIQLYYFYPLGSLDESLARRPKDIGDGRVVGDL